MGWVLKSMKNSRQLAWEFFEGTVCHMNSLNKCSFNTITDGNKDSNCQFSHFIYIKLRRYL